MPLVEIQGDMFSADTPALGHGVNTHGVMGAGVAALIREKFPRAYAGYKKRYTDGELSPGDMDAYLCTWPGSTKAVWVFNLVTQDYPGPHARVEWILESVRHALDAVEQSGYDKFVIPRLGCGIGSLSWENQVKPALTHLALAYPTVELQVWSL